MLYRHEALYHVICSVYRMSRATTGAKLEKLKQFRLKDRLVIVTQKFK
jgi:hypothetical protein